MQNPHATRRKPKIGYEWGRFGNEPLPPVGTPPWEGGELGMMN